MSFVTEILCSAEKIEVENLNKQIPDVVSRIDGYKEDVLQYLDKVYVKFSERPKSNAVLLNQADTLANNICEIEKVVNTISSRDIKEVKSNVSLYQQQLKDFKYSLHIASSLIHLHEVIIKMKVNLENKLYIEGIKQIKELEVYKDENMVKYDVFTGLIDKFAITQDNLECQLIHEFKNFVQYSDNKPFTLTIKRDTNNSEIIMAIALSKIELIDELIFFLWNHCFSSIINYIVEINISETETISKLSINILNENEKSHYKEVFENLLILVGYLSMNFNYVITNDKTTLSYIGDQLGTKLSDFIIKNCLGNTIPSNSDELQEYTKIIEDTKHLQEKLIRNCIFSENTNSIVEYVKNIDVLFINKKCEEYTAKAIEIMRKDLHDMIETEMPPNESLNSLVSSLNTFPYCLVSKSTLELIDLTYKIMQNAVASDTNAEKLYSTVQNIYHMYGSVVQEHHQKLLQTIPQQVALFHNNCMFLSYKLSIWNEMKEKTPSIAFVDPPLFMMEAHLLKEIGNQIFLESLQQQIKQIEDIMKESGLTSVTILDKLEPITEKSIRQCLTQQELLRTVWHRVLSQSDYNKSIGCILNFLCNLIINELLKIEDISTEASGQLVDIFKVILTRGPKLFTDPKDVYLYVKNWYKFNELIFILNSSSVEICDRWADGKGPLALQYKPQEVQKLIRALFQDTDRRAAVLSRIGSPL